MKTFLWITIVGSVISVLILLSGVLAASDTPQPLASLRPPAQGECDCSHLETLQIELRNAIRLQQAFRNKIPELRGKGTDSSQNALKVFAEGEARRGLEPIPGYKGPTEFDYVTWGSNQRTFNFPKEDLCRMADSAKVELDKAVAASACAGIGKALRAHEQVHENLCLSTGYPSYVGMHGADRAQEEVEAYEAQIRVLRAEIAQAMERAQITIISDVKTATTVPKNPLYTTIKIDNNAEIPTTRVSGTADRFHFEGQGTQANNVSVDGHCRITGGVPFNLPARVSIDTDGLTADVSYETLGTMPSVSMRCAIPGAGEGYGMSMPVQMTGGKVPLAKMPLKNGAEIVFDMSQSEGAKILASGGITLTGKATVRLVCK